MLRDSVPGGNLSPCFSVNWGERIRFERLPRSVDLRGEAFPFGHCRTEAFRCGKKTYIVRSAAVARVLKSLVRHLHRDVLQGLIDRATGKEDGSEEGYEEVTETSTTNGHESWPDPSWTRWQWETTTEEKATGRNVTTKRSTSWEKISGCDLCHCDVPFAMESLCRETGGTSAAAYRGSPFHPHRNKKAAECPGFVRMPQYKARKTGQKGG